MEQPSKAYYEIIIEEALDPSWSDWLNSFRITRIDNQNTCLSGWVSDQTALYGLLNTLCHLNLTLLSVHRKSDNNIEL
jgi:hypothetical protein